MNAWINNFWLDRAALAVIPLSWDLENGVKLSKKKLR